MTFYLEMEKEIIHMIFFDARVSLLWVWKMGISFELGK